MNTKKNAGKPTPGQTISYLLSALANVAEMDPDIPAEELRESRLKHIKAARAAIAKVKKGLL